MHELAEDVFFYAKGFLTKRLYPAALAVGLAVIGAAPSTLGAAVQVTTYHGDQQRTGWNSQETALTPATVGSAAFKQLNSVALDSQVDTQPLYMGGQTITGQGTHNVIYLGTENDTVYGIDADSGAVLLKRNFGTPIQINQLPGACDNNANVVGITATPVIDPATNTLYVITYTFENSAAIYRMHALDLGSLADKVTPVVLSGSGTLNPSNAKYAFSANYARSRPALALANGNVYAAFTSFCDFNANVARGWVLGWNASSLRPLPQPTLLNRESSTTNNYFLSTVWMSGYGIGVDNAGSLFVVTGNGDPAGTAYNPPYGIAESVVKISPDLTTIQSIFTPAGGNGSDYKSLEAIDGDFSSGGVMIIPTQPGPTHPNMAVAAGKFGAMYLMDSNNLGGYNQGTAAYPDNVLNAYTIGSCYCGASYFKGTDGIGRVVSSGSNTAVVWKINNGVNPSLSQESISAPIVNGTNNGFFTTISSNGAQAKSQVIWALGRPISSTPGTVNLYAFDPSTVTSGNMATLFTAAAGTWPMHGRANLVPTVANGKVYVATYQQLAIFGMSSNSDIVSFTASGTQAAGVGPLVNVIVDGKTIGSTSVGTATATYSFNTTLAPNTAHDIQIQYPNDTVINGQDRNLILSSIGIDGKTYLATSSYEIYHAEAGNQGDFASDGNMYWSGTAEFSLPASVFPVMSAVAKSTKVAAVSRLSKAPSIQTVAVTDPKLSGHGVYGVLTAMRSGELTFRTRTGTLLKVNNTAAVKSHLSVIPVVGGAFLVRGEYDNAGVLHAKSIQAVQNLKALWGKDS